jgi:hypothetical protein
MIQVSPSSQNRTERIHLIHSRIWRWRAGPPDPEVGQQGGVVGHGSVLAFVPLSWGLHLGSERSVVVACSYSTGGTIPIDP